MSSVGRRGCVSCRSLRIGGWVNGNYRHLAHLSIVSVVLDKERRESIFIYKRKTTAKVNVKRRKREVVENVAEIGTLCGWTE